MDSGAWAYQYWHGSFHDGLLPYGTKRRSSTSSVTYVCLLEYPQQVNACA